MAKSALRHRGVRVEVDTTEIAEWDIASIQIAEDVLERIARNLKTVTHSDRDRVVGDVRVREIEGYDIVFFLGMQDGVMVVTIGKVAIPDPDNATETLLKKLGPLAILRGATGL